jgi:hypothetical protein
MTLKEWMAEEGLRDQAAADHFGVERSLVTYLRGGKKTPGFKLAVRIWVRTNFKVGFEDWISKDLLKREMKLAGEKS